MHQFSFEHESTPRLRKESNWGSNETWSDEEQFLSDEDGDAYSTMNYSSTNTYHEQNSYYTPSTFPQVYHTPHHAILTHCVHHLPPSSFLCNMPHTNPTPSELDHNSHHQFQLPSPLQHQSDSDAKCNLIKPKKNANILSSTLIKKDSLLSQTQAFAKYHKLVVVSKAPTLATKLAQDAFFGEDVHRCTVNGLPRTTWTSYSRANRVCLPSSPSIGQIL